VEANRADGSRGEQVIAAMSTDSTPPLVQLLDDGLGVLIDQFVCQQVEETGSGALRDVA
jgi:hypothetical protein